MTIQIEYRGNTFDTIAATPIPTISVCKGLRAFEQVGRSCLKGDVARVELGGLDLVAYKGAVMPPVYTSHLVAMTMSASIADTLDSDPSRVVTIADIGTGSGVAALTVCHALRSYVEEQRLRVIATDICPDALSVASINAKLNGHDAHVTLRQRDMLHGLREEFGRLDYIFCNPPYYPQAMKPQNGTKFAPDLALYAPTGDQFHMYRKLFEQAQHAMNPGGQIYTVTPSYVALDVMRIGNYHLPQWNVTTENDIRGRTTAIRAMRPV